MKLTRIPYSELSDDDRAIVDEMFEANRDGLAALDRDRQPDTNGQTTEPPSNGSK